MSDFETLNQIYKDLGGNKFALTPGGSNADIRKFLLVSGQLGLMRASGYEPKKLPADFKHFEAQQPNTAHGRGETLDHIIKQIQEEEGQELVSIEPAITIAGWLNNLFEDFPINDSMKAYWSEAFMRTHATDNEELRKEFIARQEGIYSLLMYLKEFAPDNNNKITIPYLMDAHLSGMDLSGINLEVLMLKDTDLTGADFRNSTIRFEEAVSVNMNYGLFEGATVHDSVLHDCQLNNISGNKMTLIDSEFVAVELNAASLINAHLLNLSLIRTYFNSANLAGANLENAQLDTVFFSDAKHNQDTDITIDPLWHSQIYTQPRRSIVLNTKGQLVNLATLPQYLVKKAIFT